MSEFVREVGVGWIEDYMACKHGYGRVDYGACALAAAAYALFVQGASSIVQVFLREGIRWSRLYASSSGAFTNMQWAFDTVSLLGRYPYTFSFYQRVCSIHPFMIPWDFFLHEM